MNSRDLKEDWEEEPPSFGSLVNSFKTYIGKERQEALMNLFGSKESLQDMFTSLWELEDAHCYMTPVAGDGSKKYNKAFKALHKSDHNMTDEKYEEALENLNLGLSLACHPPCSSMSDYVVGHTVRKLSAGHIDHPSDLSPVSPDKYHPRDLVPQSPDHSPPRDITPRSPDHSPPRDITPRSPDHSPPRDITPRSPDHSPPRDITPRSPDHSPPRDFTPRSPDHSPPRDFTPRSPDHSHPRDFTPRSSDHSPPRDFAPRSPDHSPPRDLSPQSPDKSPPRDLSPQSPDKSPPRDQSSQIEKLRDNPKLSETSHETSPKSPVSPEKSDVKNEKQSERDLESRHRSFQSPERLKDEETGEVCEAHHEHSPRSSPSDKSKLCKAHNEPYLDDNLKYKTGKMYKSLSPEYKSLKQTSIPQKPCSPESLSKPHKLCKAHGEVIPSPNIRVPNVVPRDVHRGARRASCSGNDVESGDFTETKSKTVHDLGRKQSSGENKAADEKISRGNGESLSNNGQKADEHVSDTKVRKRTRKSGADDQPRVISVLPKIKVDLVNPLKPDDILIGSNSDKNEAEEPESCTESSELAEDVELSAKSSESTESSEILEDVELPVKSGEGTESSELVEDVVLPVKPDMIDKNKLTGCRNKNLGTVEKSSDTNSELKKENGHSKDGRTAETKTDSEYSKMCDWGNSKKLVEATVEEVLRVEKRFMERPDPNVDRYRALLDSYELRALLMYKMKEYKLCVQDCNRALCYGSKGECVIALETLKNLCEEEIKKGTKKKCKERGLIFSFGTNSAPVLEEINLNMPALSGAVKLKYSTSEGRFLVAARDITPGEILGVEEPYCSVVNRGELMKFCINCMKRTVNPVPCPNCCVVVYCSEECLESKHPHWALCSVVMPTIIGMKVDTLVMLAAHLLTKTTYKKLKDMIGDLSNELKDLPPYLAGFNEDGIYKSDYRSIYHFVTNEKELPREELFAAATSAFAIVKLMTDSADYFVDERGAYFEPSCEDVEISGTAVFHHLLGLKSSAMTLTELRVVTNDHSKTWNAPIGCGVYPSIALANHSCNPNAALYNCGRTLVLYATRSIPADKPINISYIRSFRHVTKDIRQPILKETFAFDCSCERCENDWFPDVDEVFALKCVKCGKALDLKKILCTSCQIYYREGKEYKESAPYNFFYVKDKLKQAALQCKKIKAKLLNMGECTKKDKDYVIGAIKLMEKYVKEPCTMLLDAEEVLRLMYEREGNFCLVKERTKSWLMGPAHMINSNWLCREDFITEEPVQKSPMKRKGRSRESREVLTSEMRHPPPPCIPIMETERKVEAVASGGPIYSLHNIEALL